MMTYKSIYLTILLLGCTSAGVLPVEKCKLDDSACMKNAFQTALTVFVEGIPELDVEVLDPMDIDDVAFNLSGLQFTLTDGKMKGLKGAVIDDVKWDPSKQRINIDYHLNGNVKGHYTAAGRLLILPISGDGQMKLRLKNLAVSMYIDYKIKKGADDKDYVVPTKYGFDFEIKENAHFNLSNLFNGNKELSVPMHAFLNENWQQVSVEFGRPLMEAAANKLFKNVQRFFAKQPIGDIAEL